ncbi:LysM peptidoglycan-binding domain-containing protein [Lentilactobacillus parafarraginis]|uniref:LysM domain protein n=2 Tax=Lentilactobacillus parafarraginis TaxID=390842 RepID=A0A0R1YNF0_9LACO|nr:LysM domain-containing protein [Lentilactobacillus parafarraginis]KRM44016.1 LysM domain protein [Lentilactobacillus parafarraginis DSM 18390 = JCM 14109]TLQ20477.1 LysM peptidoglycan-binding domain-containing protein [Lentilactobacillus parafarraginis]
MILATSAAAVGIFFAGFSYASASTVVTVQSGDTVWGLSQKYNVSIDAINQANNLNSSNVIVVGEQLNIPDGSQTSQATSTQQPAQQTTTTQSSYTQPQYSQAQQSTNNYASTTANTNTSSNSNANYSTASTGASDGGSAKAWIASHESGGSYSARNGQYVGKYQLSASYLNGDYSAANQEKVANQYVSSRYGSWSAAKSFWQANGWY